MNCLVTGGGGFIGSNLVDRLLKDENQVVVLDNFSTGKESNLAEHEFDKNLEVVEADICDSLTEIFQDNKFDTVFHLAALPRVQFSIDNPEITWKVNARGTFNLLSASAVHEVKRFVFSSSSSIYGDQEIMPFKEHMKLNPKSPYAEQKLRSERYCKLYAKRFGLETIMLRYFNVFGPKADPNGGYAQLIPKFIDLISSMERPQIKGDGEQTRDFIYVDNIVEANLLAAKTKNKNCFGQAFNIGNGKSYSVNKITDLLLKMLDKKIESEYVDAVKEPRHTLADYSKAERMLGWKPRVSFEEGLERTIEYFIGNSPRRI